MIRMLILYGVEIWPIKKLDEKKCLILERKIFGPVKENISKK